MLLNVVHFLEGGLSMGGMTEKQVAFVLRRGEDLREEIDAREKYLRVVGDDIGTFPSDVRVQCSPVDYPIEKLVDRLRDDPVLKRMRLWTAQYLSIMGKLTPRQRTFVYWRYRRGLSLAETAQKMGTCVRAVELHHQRIFDALKKCGIIA